MANYTFGIPYCIINAIRSVRTDTLIASSALRVMNAQGGLHQDWGTTPAMNLGDFGPHSMVNTNLYYSNVDVPDASASEPDGGAVYWSFILSNAGHANSDPSAATTAINNAAAGVVGALVSSGNIMAEIAAGVIVGAQALLQIFTANCDGVVVAFGLAFTAAELAAMTPNPATCPCDELPRDRQCARMRGKFKLRRPLRHR